MEEAEEHKSIIDVKADKRELKRLKREQKNSDDRKIYTLGGEIFSSITHGIAAVAGLVVLIVCIILATRAGLGTRAIVSVTVFGITAFLGFTISTVYHALRIGRGKRALRVLDHCSIYFIIAGTYTPFALMVVGGWVGWTLCLTNWALAALGTTLTAVNRVKFHKFAFVCYLVMGWLAVAAVVPLVRSTGWGLVFWLLVGGGVAYTIGAVIFKMKGKYIHGVWHLFTLAGLLLHFFSIAVYMGF